MFKTEIIPEGTWFQIGQANSSDWIEYEVWSASTEHIFAPLNTPLVHAVAENMQIDSQNILTSRTMENGYPYALFLPRKQLPPAPESVVSLRRLLQLPFGISPRVQQLANQIFADCKTSAEKINRVQNYFQNQYEYEIGIKIPQGNDPLTYFLLEKPNAHCEYFASGTAILLRMAGVPCRYVTGYIVRERNVYDQFWVARSRHAHAWVEAWDEQSGWGHCRIHAGSRSARSKYTRRGQAVLGIVNRPVFPIENSCATRRVGLGAFRGTATIGTAHLRCGALVWVQVGFSILSKTTERAGSLSAKSSACSGIASTAGTDGSTAGEA